MKIPKDKATRFGQQLIVPQRYGEEGLNAAKHKLSIDILEEVANCLVVLKQFQLSFEIADLTLEEFAILKTERTLQRIESESITDNLKEVESNL